MAEVSNLKFEKVSKVGRVDFKTQDFSGLSKFESISPPSVFIGSKLKYPFVNVGILSPLGDEGNASLYEDYKKWVKEDFSIPDILKLRQGLLNSKFKSTVYDSRLNKKFIDFTRLVALSSKPVDVEIELKNKIFSKIGKDRVLAPIGLNAEMKDLNVTSNVSVEKIIEKIINDDLKAVDGMNILYEKGINEYSLQKILSVGGIGMKKNSKFVPTKWSITATDDIIGKNLLTKIRDFKEIEKHVFFYGEFLGNQYLIFLFPGKFNFELFELYYPGSSWNSTKEFKASHDYENFFGRTLYAKNCAGGYYATRLAILEYLDSIKKQAGVLVIRLETPSYWASLGVWVVRESVRQAIYNGGMNFQDKEELLNSAVQISKIKYDFNPSIIYEKSWYLNFYSKQKNINDWM